MSILPGILLIWGAKYPHMRRKLFSTGCVGFRSTATRFNHQMLSTMVKCRRWRSNQTIHVPSIWSSQRELFSLYVGEIWWLNSCFIMQNFCKEAQNAVSSHFDENGGSKPFHDDNYPHSCIKHANNNLWLIDDIYTKSWCLDWMDTQLDVGPWCEKANNLSRFFLDGKWTFPSSRRFSC